MNRDSSQPIAELEVQHDAAGVPVAFGLLRVGANPLIKDGVSYVLTLSADDLATIARNYATKGNKIPVDAKHILATVGSMVGTDEDKLAKDNPALFSELMNGMLALEQRDGRIWAVVEKWSDAVRNIFAGGRSFIPYFSPVLRPIRVNAETGTLEITDRSKLRITSVTLTADPALNHLPSLAACEAADGSDYAFAVLKQTEPAGTKTKEGVRMKEMLKRLGVLLGLKNDSLEMSDAEVPTKGEPIVAAAHTEIEGLRGKIASFVAGVATTLKLSATSTLDDVLAAVKLLASKADGTQLALTELNNSVAGLIADKKSNMIKGLLAAGKLTHAMIPWAEKQDVLALTEWSKAAPVLVPGGIVPQHEQQGGGTALVMTETEINVAKACGLNPADVAKQAGKKLPGAVAALLCLFAFVFAMLFSGTNTLAAAATANVDAPDRPGMAIAVLASSNHIYAGTIGAVDANGKAAPAADTAGLKVIGRVAAEVDNTGSNYGTNTNVKIERGTFRWSNGGSFTAADIGTYAYVLDDKTVITAAQATNDITAGLIVSVDSSGVWLDTTFAAVSRGASITQAIYTVAAGTANAITNSLKTSAGRVVSFP